MATLYCVDVERESWFPGCCDSCHDDSDERGYDLFEFVTATGRDAVVCCRVYNAIKIHEARDAQPAAAEE